MPMWVKIFVGLGILVVLAIIVVLVVGGGEHGPGRHLGGYRPLWPAMHRFA